MPGPLDFLFELDAKIDGAVKMLETVNESVKALHNLDKATSSTKASVEHVDRASAHAAATHDKHGHSIVALGHHYEYAKNGIHEFAEALGLVLAFEAVEKIVDKVKELGEEIVMTAAKAQRSRVAMELFFGKEKGSELMEYAEQFSKASEFKVPDVRGFISDLGRAGFNAEQIPRALAAAGELAARNPDKMAGMQSAIMGLGMVKTTGRVEGRLFRRLGIGEENAPEKFYGELSMRTGKGVAQLKKDMEKGKVPIEDEVEALYSIIAGDKGLGHGAVEMGKTAGAKIAHFSEIPEKLMETVEKSPAFAKLIEFVDKLTQLLSPEGPLGEKFAHSLGDTFGKIVDQLAKINERDLSEFVDVLMSIPPILVETTKALKGLLDTWIQFRTATKGSPVPESAGGKVGWLGGMTLRPIEDELQRLLGMKKGGGVLDAVHAMVTVGHLTDRLGITGKGAAEGMADGIRASTPKVEAAARGMGEAAHGGVKDELQIHSPSKVFEHLGRMSGEGYMGGLDDSLSRMTDSVPAGAFARPASGGAGGPMQVTVHIETHVASHGGGDHGAEQIGAQVATHVESILPGALQAAFEKLQLEAGS